MKSTNESKSLVKRESDYKVVHKTWGFERWIINEKGYCGKEIFCIYGRWSSEGKFHFHKIKDETFYVVSGMLEVEIKPAKEIIKFHLKRGDSIRIKPSISHRFRSEGRIMVARFFEFSTYHSDEDTYYI